MANTKDWVKGRIAGAPSLFAQAVAVFLLAMGSNTSVRAQVVTDGTVGPALDFGNGDAVVPSIVGTAVGANLFHSFQLFSINAGSTVTFTGPGQFNHVVARVTGGLSSIIDGTLISQVGDQGFYLINPAGVVIGPNASIDVPSAFHVSDAGEIRFSDGARFSAADRGASVLTAAAPTEFGFLNAGSGGLAAFGAFVAGGQTLDLSASGGLFVSGSVLASFGGDVRLQAVAPGGVLDVTTTTPSAAPGAFALSVQGSTLGALPGQVGLGGDAVNLDTVDVVLDGSSGPPTSLTVTAGALDMVGLDVSAGNAESVFRFATASLDNVTIASSTDNFAPGGAVAFLGGDLTVNNSIVQTSTSFAGGGGAVILDVGTLQLTDSALVGFTSGFAPGGDFNLAFASLTATDSFVGAVASGFAPGGAVTLAGASATITGGLFTPLGGFAAVSSEALGSAPGGAVTLAIDSLHLVDAPVSSATFGSEGGGDIALTFDQLTLERSDISATAGDTGPSGSIALTGIRADFVGTPVLEARAFTFATGSGAGGDVTVAVNDLTLGTGTGIQTQSLTSAAGRLSITADSLTMTGEPGGEPLIAAIGAGPSEMLDLTVQRLELGANSSVFVSATAGDARMTAQGNDLTVADGAIVFVSSNAATAELDLDFASIALDGRILLNSEATDGDVLLSLNAGSLAAGPTSVLGIGSGPGGVPTARIHVSADAAFLGDLIAGDLSAFNINTGAGDITGGVVEINAGQSITVEGQIGAFALGAGDGGSISLVAPQIMADNGFVTVASKDGAPGLLSITADDLLLKNGTVIDATTTGLGNGGRIEIVTDTLTLDDGPEGPSGIASNSAPETLIIQPGGGVVSIPGEPQDPAGNGGSIAVDARVLNSLGGVIAASTLAGGNGGGITVTADTILINERGAITARSSGFGDGGDVFVKARDIRLEDRARIDSLAESEGDAGTVTIMANLLTLTTTAEIATFSTLSGGGQIAVMGADRLLLDNAFITSSVSDGTGNGGNIDVDASLIVLLPNSAIAANAFEGQGGALSIVTDALFQTLGTQITASSTLGIDGTVNISGPQNPETAEVVGLPSDFLAANAVLQNPCLAALVGRSDLTGSGSARAHRLDEAPAGLFLDQLSYPVDTAAAISSGVPSPQLASLDVPTGGCRLAATGG